VSAIVFLQLAICMANVTLRKEERKTPFVQEGYLRSQNDSNEDAIFVSFQNLEVDETRLIEQKEHLTALLSQLEVKAKEEVEKRKQRVNKLNSEVSDLKLRCEKFANFVNSS
jgi:hypothetical protein